MIFALGGNQNCGKTTLFNQLTGSNQHVGNFPGVTVEGKSGTVKGHPEVTVVDLPGIYSLSPYTSEEIVTRDYLINEKIDCIINITDATNIERNLYLSLQLMELDIPMVIALNMMAKPKLLFLDEPTVGMDIQSRRLMWEMINKIRTDFGTTVFLTTHYLEEADNLSDTICIMKDGKEVIQGTPLELRTYLRQDTLQIYFPNVSVLKQYFPQLQKHFYEQEIYVRNAVLVIHTHDSKNDMEKAVCFLLQKSIPFTGIEITQPTLEDVFLRLTSKSEGV